MKRIIIIMAINVLLIISCCLPAGAAEVKIDVNSKQYILNGNTYQMDASPYLKNGCVFLPLRYVGLVWGLEEQNIIWDDPAKTVTLMKGDKVVQVKIGSTTMLVNGVDITMDVAPEVKDGRIMLPLSYIASAFGGTLKWDESVQEITLYTDAEDNGLAAALPQTEGNKALVEGIVHLNQQEYKEALEDFNKAIALEGTDERVYYERGIVYYKMYEYKNAISDFCKVIEKNPNNLSAYSWRGWSYYHINKHEWGIRDLTKAIELSPSSNTYADRAFMYQWCGRSDALGYLKSINDFNIALGLNPNVSIYYTGRGWSYFYNGEAAKAKEDFKKALEIDPYDSGALRGLSRIK